jgi:predicted metal-dependent peptidase
MIIQRPDDALYNRKVMRAATALVIRHPFFGYMLFGASVKVLPSDSVPTMATDGVSIFCGVAFVHDEPAEILEFGLLHELLHIYFNHVARRGTRNARTWNIAADIFDNGQCSELLKWSIPTRFVQPVYWAEGKSVEEIYDLLTPEALESLPTSNGVGTGDDMMEPPTGEDLQADKEWRRTFQQEVAQAKAMADRSVLAKRPLTAAVRDRMMKITKATLPWGTILRGDLSSDLGFDEATYCPPKVKYYPIILPQTRSTKERVLLLGIDISASVTDELIKIFISNVMSAALRATKTIVVTFDQVQRDYHETTNPKDIFRFVKFVSGDHYMTSAMCIFEHAARIRPSAICVLTDGHIKVPETPYKNTTFVIPEGGAKLPWGRHIVMEYQW